MPSNENSRPALKLVASSDCKPELVIDYANLPATALKLRDFLATSAKLFFRGVPVKISPQQSGIPSVTPLSRHNVVIEAHEVCRPVTREAKGSVQPVTLPYAVVELYLALKGEWNLPPLVGVTTAPLLEGDGSIRVRDGYDDGRGLWCSNIPKLSLQERPNVDDAQAALFKLRHAFRTFPFADAARKRENSALEVVDLDQPPAYDECAFLTALLTATCRPSLSLAPGFLVHAPSISGAGTGKGMLVRAISAIAFGCPPKPFTAGENRNELEKRIAAALVTAEPILFLDNFNGRALKSELLAQAVTENSVIVRRLGATCMVPLSSKVFVAVTGNGLTIAEDLARRFVHCELNARCENPEQRNFPPHFLEDILGQRAELLTAAFTILRWGRQNAAELVRGRPLGSFEDWASWCRDPLLTLGAQDPVERINAIKASDPERLAIAEIFETWHAHHVDRPVAVVDLAEPVRKLLNPQGRSRQYLASRVASLANTRVGGFELTQQKPVGRWGHATYAVVRTDE